MIVEKLLAGAGFVACGLAGAIVMGGLVVVPAAIVWRLRGWLDFHHGSR